MNLHWTQIVYNVRLYDRGDITQCGSSTVMSFCFFFFTEQTSLEINRYVKEPVKKPKRDIFADNILENFLYVEQLICVFVFQISNGIWILWRKFYFYPLRALKMSSTSLQQRGTRFAELQWKVYLMFLCYRQYGWFRNFIKATCKMPTFFLGKVNKNYDFQYYFTHNLGIL